LDGIGLVMLRSRLASTTMPPRVGKTFECSLVTKPLAVPQVRYLMGFTVG
jgi:hypothetical protein